MARLRDHYSQVVVPKLREELSCSNDFSVPRLVKVVLNMGVGEATADSKHIKMAVDELTWIAGQRAVATRARKSVATFKVREGQQIGAMATLRGPRMYEFIDRLTTIALPRVRDFRGLSLRSFDGRGNYSFGIKEQIVFPEVGSKNVDVIRGLDVCVVTTAKTDKACYSLLKAFNFPFIAQK
ncbi:MAG: 50S ribosomal protein L5 [Holosporales bacterium]|jgi:large subunit ribosomal protein L5|nr:50S ribosomal protein L5 [Holosporales bacterium]